ncbi:DNA repair protein RecN [Gemmatimonas sp.]|jgi:DNA repair protein RecN (Recombination protein N)|uniref:DNA repair protein RecN n=1 Tax=Gemmatimonas sp. TaxID=1962908 RepID=UPI0037BE848D
MLVELRIRNVAVIDTVSLPLAGGLNVLTGETGAGKSLIIGALGMLLGERAAADRVRAGAERATVEGVFDLRGLPAVRVLLDERGVEADDDLLVLKREVGANGRSRAWINGSAVTASVLADVGARLVSVHGQHDSRQLVDADHQREVLDAYVQADAARAGVAAAHAQLVALRARERELEQGRQDAMRRADYLRFVAREIEEVNPVIGEDDALDADIRRLAHAEELQGLAAQAAAAITGDDRAALTRLATVRRALASLVRIDPSLERLQSGFDAAVYALDELTTELESYAETIEADPQRLRTLERRRDQLVSLMRKYGPTMPEVLAAAAEASTALDLLDGGTLDLAAIADARASAEGALAEAAAELTRLRQRGAHRFARAVTALLPELGMREGRVEVVLAPLEAIGAAGAESVAFVAALNAGSDMRPLSRIASGGELSRVMLALSTVLARLQQVPTLVFDEVDAGVGGAVAWQVGALMRRVASHHQVLAISHLAQIAARAHHHIVVHKSAVGTVTTSDTTVVIDDARVVEIARMLGGDADREVSRAHARELLTRGSEDVQALADVGATLEVTPSATPKRQRRGKPV